MQERNIECRWVLDATNLDQWAAKIDRNTRFLYGELPSNPQQGFFDIRAVADLAHSHNLPLICDSTMATPALLRPICHGADIVVQSATKSLTSSGFGVCGAVIARKNLVTNIDRPATEDRFFALHQVPAEPRFRPQSAPDAGGDDAERHAHPAVENGPDEPQYDEGGRVSPAAPAGGKRAVSWACPIIRCTNWPASTCGWSMRSTTTNMASR